VAVAGEPSTGAPRLSILIVSYECRDALLRCLASLDAGTRGIAHEVIVVDNASADGTAEAVRRLHPEVVLIASGENRGFSWASNRAMERATGEHLLLLNPDTVVPDGALTAAVEALEARPDVGMLGCKLVQADGSLDKACKRGFPTPLSSLAYFTGVSRLAPRHRTLGGYNAGHVAEDETAIVDAVNGAFMLVRRDALDAVGPLDERYWMYMEDLDWCYRFHEAGWPVLYWPEVEVVHEKAVSSGRPRRWRTNYAFHRGMWLFYRTHYAPTRPRAVTSLVWVGVWSKLGVSACSSAITRSLRAGQRRVVRAG
jgi:GT2 family glycosyltransferase